MLNGYQLKGRELVTEWDQAVPNDQVEDGHEHPTAHRGAIVHSDHTQYQQQHHNTPDPYFEDDSSAMMF